jgi:hypothetical protein
MHRMRKPLFVFATSFILASFIQPAWDWYYTGFLNDAAKDPNAIVQRIQGVISMVAPFQPYFIGIALGLLIAILPTINWRARSNDKYRELGHDAVDHAHLIADWLANPFLHTDYTQYMAKTYSILLRFRALKFDVLDTPPSATQPEKLGMARQYCMIVGTLLANGHTGEARECAKEVCRQISASNGGTNPSPQLPRSIGPKTSP